MNKYLNKSSEIDINIKSLVYHLNKVKGITTLFSCSGHSLGQEGYVTFKADSQKALLKLVSLLPMEWKACGWKENRPYSRHLWVNVELMPKEGLVYSLRFQGSPFYEQLELINDIDQAIRKGVY